MVIKFIVFGTDDKIIVLKETSTLTTPAPQIGWNVIINQESYFVDAIEMSYDNGIINVNLTK